MRQTNEQICHKIMQFLMDKKKLGYTWVPMTELYALDPKPPRVYKMLHYMNEKVIYIDRSKPIRVVSLKKHS
jgi:hypothetical protein